MGVKRTFINAKEYCLHNKKASLTDVDHICFKPTVITFNTSETHTLEAAAIVLKYVM